MLSLTFKGTIINPFSHRQIETKSNYMSFPGLSPLKIKYICVSSMLWLTTLTPVLSRSEQRLPLSLAQQQTWTKTNSGMDMGHKLCQWKLFIA